ncbi:hypothetical protein [Halalkalibacter okhensis]|uniref:Uncharacterized protein n=1 Tax=Halalkalibacter okhensis TaxID=333138 RepID=A0A0B0IBF5_9BACI|nr:hypothetical protein [Halalkalibacter okhensis]KHF39863.1 hypothetical protein LQ50_12405 [Halalkalibacter okhensis]
MDKKQYVELKHKVEQLNRETDDYLKEMKTILSKVKQNQKLNMVSYFTYSFNISYNQEQESFIIGTYHIHNLGNKLLTNPYICIKLSPDAPFRFYGKYINKKTNLSMQTPDAWERINEQTDKNEYWLRPIAKQTLEPNHVISFPNFQIKWLSTESYSGSIMGFTYCDEFKEGIPAVNQIYVNGIYK